MRLRSKLSIVLALLVFTLVANVALSIWSIRFLERELSEPLLSMQSVMKHLHNMKRTGEREIDLLDRWRVQNIREIDDNQGLQNESVIDIHSQISILEKSNIEILDELEEQPGVMLRSGVTTIENLRDRSLEIGRLNERWMKSSADENALQLILRIDNRHELIELIEGQILDDAVLASGFGKHLKSWIHSIIIVTLIGALAIGVLMVLFIRSWILSPIEQLRDGANRFSLGDFENSINVRTNDELGQLGDEFNRMGVLIQEMQDQRVERERLAAMGEMAQRTVHNFRTPLSSIRALSEVVLDDLHAGSESHGFQSRIIETVDRFNLQLNEMLRASSPLELMMKSVDPTELVRSVMADHEGASESKHQQLGFVSLNPPSMVSVDPYHLGHAITAILSNAIEFAPVESKIDIILSQSEEADGSYWTLRISNNGPMIPKDLHRSIFRPYFTTRRSGTGIGLAMTQRVVDQHLGRIRINSPLDTDHNMGCAFEMLIPIKSAVI